MGKRIKVALLFMFLIFAGLLVCNGDTFAASGGAWFGTGDATITPPSGDGHHYDGTGCYDANDSFMWRVDCTGVSWIYYEAQSETYSDTAFPYRPYVKGTVSATIPSTCSEVHNGARGGFWHFGINSYGAHLVGQTIWTGPGGYYGHWITAPFGYYSIYGSTYGIKYGTDGTPDQTVGVYQAKYYGDYDTVLNAYNEARTTAGYDTVDGIPDNLYAFCYWPGANTNADFLGASESTVTETKDTGNSDSASVGPVAMNAGQSATATITVKKGSSARLTFSHNVYSKKSMKTIYWTVDRPDVSAFSPVPRRFSNNNSMISRFGYTKENGYYIPMVRQSGRYILTDEVVLSFSTAGEYTFCESLKMKQGGYPSKSTSITSKACVKVIVKDEPPEEEEEIHEPVSGTTTVLSEVKNDDLSSSSSFSGWRGQENLPGENESINVTYAKPGDKIEWRNKYMPGAQVNAGNTITISHGPVGEYDSTCPTNEKIFKDQYSFVNKYEVYTDSPFGMNGLSYKNSDPFKNSYLPGDLGAGVTATQAVEAAKNSYVVEKNKVGKTFHDTINTSDGVPSYTSVTEDTHKWTYKYWVPAPCYDDEGNAVAGDCGGYATANASHTVYEYEYAANKLTSQSYVKIPYNYKNDADFSMSPAEDMVYAGETVSVKDAVVKVGNKYNDVIKAEYATNVDGARVKLIKYVSNVNRAGDGTRTDFSCGVYGSEDISPYGLCEEVRDLSGTLEAGDAGAEKEHNNNILGVDFNGTYEVFDAKAGDWFCMSIGVYPATSGGDKNMDASGDKSWYVYTPTCYQIAKKPSLQIWGGGLFSSGSIFTSVSEKNYVYGLGKIGPVVFGSWVEEDLIAEKGKVTNFASGAGLGKNDKSSAGSGLNGTINNRFCSDLVALTIANKVDGVCKNDGVGNSGITSSLTSISSLVNYFESFSNKSDARSPGRFGDYVEKISSTGKAIQFYEIDNNDALLSGTDISISNGNDYIPSTTAIVRADRNIHIDHNIIIVGPASSTNQISQVVVYADGDINISCNVDRLDAVLIARGTIDTCYDGGDINSVARSRQLLINGALVAGKLVPGRTYGNTMGVVGGSWNIGSETPAEIINYDTSMLLWGWGMADSAESGTLTMTYQHELAPRY
ncbi:hypothetical protein IKF12_02290 [Candidatus Saccharibacteria bacterium]|nr:hypothetical protein [Candidatus Saccharibacteria bacterium]